MSNVMIGGIGAVRKPKVKSIEIWGKRWFQKTYGNTYHAVKVYVNDQLIGTSPISYGYGDQYIQTAEELLKKAGYLKRKDPRQSLWSYCSEKKIKLKYYATDVDTQKELKNFAQ